MARTSILLWASVTVVTLNSPIAATLTGSQPAGGGLCFAPGAWTLLLGKGGGVPASQRLQAPAPRHRVLGGLSGEIRGQGARDDTAKVQGPGIVRAAKAATFSLFLLGAALLPPSRQASASIDDGVVMGADGTIQQQSQKGALPLGKIGAAAGASVLTFGSTCAVAIKKEKRRCQEDREELEKDVARLNSFKEEFLEGKISDRSLYSSLKKKTKTSDEDDFDRNVREFMEEEENKKKGKKDPKRKESPTVLERPGEKRPDDDLDDIYSQEEHEPAAIDESVRAMLEKMLGGGGEEEKK